MTQPHGLEDRQTLDPSGTGTHRFLQRTCALVQALFAAFWAFRFGLAGDNVLIAVLLPAALLGAVLLLNSRVKLPIRRPGRDPLSRSMVRRLNVMTVAQLAVSGILPFVVPSNWMLASIMITIGLLLLGVYGVLRAPPLLIAGPLLIAAPAAVALTEGSPDALVALIGAVCLSGSSLAMLLRLIVGQKDKWAHRSAV